MMRTTALLFIYLSSGYWLNAQPNGSITQGAGTITTTDLMPGCPSNHVTPMGTITSTDNKIWEVPASNHFSTGPYLADLYNQCNAITPANLSAINLNNVPVTTIDQHGDTITAFLFCDNYFELYINDVLVGVDAVPFTPFNSSVTRFVVSRPYTIAVKLVDWEEHPGLGSEIQATDSFHAGDGGFIAAFSDGTVTSSDWKAQCFYIAPLQDTNDVQELANGVHSTSAAPTNPGCKSNCYGVHYDLPINWTSGSFDDSQWPFAYTYAASLVTNQPAYTNFAATAWSNSSFIWSSNLVLDNVVLARKTVSGFDNISQTSPGDMIRVISLFSSAIEIYCSIGLTDTKLELIDMQGKRISSWSGSSYSAPGLISLPIEAGLPWGIYLLRIHSTSFSITKQIIHTPHY